MANVISLQFSDTIEVNTGRLDYTGNDLDDNDIGYWIGTQGYSVAYSDISLSGEVTATPNITSSFNRNTTADSVNIITNGANVDWTFANYVILPTSITLAIRGDGSSTTIDFTLQAANESGGYDILGSFTQALGSSYARYNFSVSPDFWSRSFRFVKSSGNNVRIEEIYMYGAFRREDNDTLGFFPANGTVEAVKDSVLSINSTNGPLDYQGKLDSRLNVILAATRITLTGDITIGDKGQDIILSFDPNGANRNIILPQNPRLDHYLKIINVDGANALNIRETVGGPIIQELSNASTVLTLEAIWVQEDSTWHITS